MQSPGIVATTQTCVVSHAHIVKVHFQAPLYIRRVKNVKSCPWCSVLLFTLLFFISYLVGWP
uniref:Uncharacterized protein n=1 Tax=Physcomitrium patens TaxID=3218 RepID=A0A2K1ITJ1_PHYPA|nr:hypothetical protein PHYPA_024534 [Physcomitrium patens]